MAESSTPAGASLTTVLAGCYTQRHFACRPLRCSRRCRLRLAARISPSATSSTTPSVHRSLICSPGPTIYPARPQLRLLFLSYSPLRGSSWPLTRSYLSSTHPERRSVIYPYPSSLFPKSIIPPTLQCHADVCCNCFCLFFSCPKGSWSLIYSMRYMPRTQSRSTRFIRLCMALSSRKSMLQSKWHLLDLRATTSSLSGSSGRFSRVTATMYVLSLFWSSISACYADGK